MDLLDDNSELVEISRRYRRQLSLSRISILVTMAIFWLEDYWLAKNGNEVNFEREGLYIAITILILTLTFLSYSKPYSTFILLIGIVGCTIVTFSCAVVYTAVEIFGANIPPLFAIWAGAIILALFFTCSMLVKSTILSKKHRHTLK